MVCFRVRLPYRDFWIGASVAVADYDAGVFFRTEEDEG